MTDTLNYAVKICLATTLFPCPAVVGQQAPTGNTGVSTQTPALPAESPLTPDRLFELASPAVVKLTIRDEDDREIGIASGFIVRYERDEHDAQGQALYKCTIITNYHVIRPAISIDVLFSDGNTGWGSRVVAEDESADLAVLLASSLAEPKRALTLQDSANAPIGTKVYAIGSPQGLSNTLSQGLISGYRERGKHEPWIQITAPISPGSSGGPLFSAEGLVLGVTTAFFSEGQNLNFAVPASEVSRLLGRTAKPRPIWQGASIYETEKGAFLRAEISFYFHFRQANPKERPDGQSEQTFESFREEQLSAGDQLALLQKGRELYLSEQYAEAISMLRRATKADSGEYAYLTHLLLARAIYRNLSTSTPTRKPVSVYEDVVEPLRRAKELNPDFGPTRYELSSTYRLLDLYPEMLVEAESLVRLMPRCYDGYSLRGEAWAYLGREEAFERDLETACDLRPNDRDVLYVKAGGYFSLDKWQKAVDMYKDVLKLDENWWPAYCGIGNALLKMGKCDEAIKSYQRAVEINGTWTLIDTGVQDRIAECRRQMKQSP